MARQKGEVSKSEEVRRLLRENPKIPVKDVVSALGDRGISVTANLVYFVKGKMKGRRQRAKKVVDAVAVATGNSDPIKTILKVKALADEMGGVKKLKALVDVIAG